MLYRRLRAATSQVASYDLGGVLASVVPAIQLPYIPVTKAQEVPLDLGNIKEKLRLQSEENLGKALKSTDDLWNSTMANQKLLPHQKELLNQQRQKFYQEMHEKVSQNPAYFANQANLMEVSQRMQNLVHSPVIDAMRLKTDEVEKRDAKLASIDGAYDAPARDEHGQVRIDPETGDILTEKRWLDLLKTSTNPELYKMLSFQADRPAGNYTVGNWTGTMADVEKDTDGWANLAKASGWKKGRGGWEIQGLSPEQKAAFGTSYEGLSNYQKTLGGSSNSSALGAITSALLGKGAMDWKKKLSAPAVQGLTNHFFQAYQENSFGEHFSNTALTDKQGKDISPATSIAQVAVMARRGMLKNSKEILGLIDNQRENYINRQARGYLATRINAQNFSESEDMETHDINLTKAGEADKDGAGKDGYEGNMISGLGNRNAVQVPQADAQNGEATVNMYAWSPNPATIKRRQDLYEPAKRAPSLYDVTAGGAQPSYLPAMANQNLSESWGIPGMATDNMSNRGLQQLVKIHRYVSDVKVPNTTTNGAVAQLNTQVNKLSQKQSELQAKLQIPGMITTPYVKQELAQVQQQLQQAQQQLQQAVGADEAPMRHTVIGVMKFDDFKKYQQRFMSRDQQGATKGSFHPLLGIPVLPNTELGVDLDGNKGGASNINNVSRFDPAYNQPGERERMGYGPDDNLVQFEIQIQRPMQDRQDDGDKGSAEFYRKMMLRQRQGEMQRNVLDATIPMAPQ